MNLYKYSHSLTVNWQKGQFDAAMTTCFMMTATWGLNINWIATYRQSKKAEWAEM